MLVNAAILYPNGEIVTARRHYLIIRLQYQLAGIKSNTPDCIQGFVDHTGKFYTREEAKAIALECHQVSEDHNGTLYSEDLWPSLEMVDEIR